MDEQNLDLYLVSDIERYRRRPHVVQRISKSKLGISLSTEVINKLGLVEGLDYCIQTIEGNNTVVLRFYRKGAAEI